ncbi:glycosyltransferase family 8 protein [Leminorella grimontii]|uniref:glycosyltransferase family 8 protein n=1 Tax=Leminorella grimontii TaxID=82981 RepID=UPI0032207732
MSSFIREIIKLGDIEENNSFLNVSYGVDESFLFGAAISITSVLMNNRKLRLSFHVFTDYIDDDYITRFNELSEQFNTNINIYLIDPKAFSSLPTSQIWSYATYFRLLSFDYLSNFISSVLYLDADIVCKGQLDYIYNMEFDGKFAAVVLDVSDMQSKSAERLNWPELVGKYFNAGMVYVNLAAWAEYDLTNKSLRLLRGESEYGYLKYLDQDALNISFNMNNIYLPRDYNCIYTIKNELKAKNQNEYKEIIKDSTVFIHYTGATKPWHEWANYPSSQYFLQAWRISPWKQRPLKNAEKIVEWKKKYKHEFKQGRYLKAVISGIKYSLVKRNKGNK